MSTEKKKRIKNKYRNGIFTKGYSDQETLSKYHTLLLACMLTPEIDGFETK